jgi:hypothetical protein
VEKAWEDHHSLQFELYFELSLCLYWAGTFSAAEEIFELLLLKSKTLHEKVDVYLQKLLLCFSVRRRFLIPPIPSPCLFTSYLTLLNFQMSQHDEATKGGVACLGVLGISIPFVPTDDEVSSALKQVEAALKDRDFSDIVALEPATDMKVPKCFSEMTAPAWFQR